MTSGSETYLTMRALVDAAAAVTGVPVAAILGPKRPQRLVLVRACIAHIADQERAKHPGSLRTRWSLPLIAKGLAYRDHTSVLNLLGNWPLYCQVSPELPALVERIRAKALGLAPEPELEPEPEPEPERQASSLGSNQHIDLADILDAPPSHYRKARNDFRAEDPNDADGGHTFHAKMAKASVRFATALLAAKGIAT